MHLLSKSKLNITAGEGEIKVKSTQAITGTSKTFDQPIKCVQRYREATVWLGQLLNQGTDIYPVAGQKTNPQIYLEKNPSRLRLRDSSLYPPTDKDSGQDGYEIRLI